MPRWFVNISRFQKVPEIDYLSNRKFLKMEETKLHEGMPVPKARQLAAVMFTDMTGYTAMMQEDEKKAKVLGTRQRTTLEKLIPLYNGKILQYYGDGTLSIFGSATEAVICAAEIQKELQKEPKVLLRIGLHSGDIAYDDHGVYGDSVNVASRIESLAIPGAVLISDKVYDEIKNQSEIKTRVLGKYSLKNVKRQVEVYAVANEGLVVPTPEQIHAKAITENSRLFCHL